MSDLKILLSTGLDFTTANKDLQDYINKISSGQKIKLKFDIDTSTLSTVSLLFNGQVSESNEVDSAIKRTNESIKKQSRNTEEVNNKLKEQLELFKRSQTLSANSSIRRYSHISGAEKELTNYRNALDNIIVSNGKWIDSSTGMEVNAKSLRMDFRELRDAIAESETPLDTIRQNMQKFGSWIASSTITLALTQGIKEMISSVNELSDAFIGLKRVTDETDITYEKFRSSIFDIANELGVQAEEFVNSVSDFSKLGYSFEEAQNLAINASKLATAGEMSLETATNNLSSAYAVFKDEISGVEDLSDLFNAFGNKMAVSSESISTALTDSANSLKIAGNTVQESLSMIAGANLSVLDTSKVSNGLRTISMRLRGVSEDGEKLSSDLRGLILENTNGMVDIWDEATNNFKSTFDIVVELGKAFETTGAKQMNSAQKSLILEETAGKNRAEIMASLLQNYKEVERGMEVASQATGATQQEMEVAMESVAFKTEQLKNAFAELANTSYNSDISKFFLDTATSVVQLINDLGGLPPILTTISGLMIAMKSDNIASSIGDFTKNFSSALDTLKLMSMQFNEAKASGMSFSQALISVSKSAGLSKVSLSGLVTGIGAVISVLSIAYSMYQKHEAELERMKQQRLENAEATIKEAENIESLKNKYSEITNSSKSFSEKKAELKELQFELIKTYGNEASEIDLVNGKYEEQIGILEKLKSKKYDTSIREFKNEYDEDKTAVDKQMANTTIQGEDNYNFKYWEDLQTAINSVNDAMGKTIVTLNGNGLKFDVDNADQYVESIDRMLGLMETYGLTQNALYDNLNTKLSNLQEVTDNLSESQESYFNKLANKDLSDIGQKLGIEQLSNMTAEQISSIKEEFAKLNREEDFENYFNAYVDTLEKIPEATNNATDGLKSVEDALAEAGDNYNKAVESIATLNDILDSKNIKSSSNIKKITKDYPELLKYIGDEAQLREHINLQIEDEKNTAVYAMRQMLQAEGEYYNSANAMSEEYYNNKILGNQTTCQQLSNDLSTFFSSLGLAYEGDLSNYKNMEQAKASVTEQLINKLGTAWQTFFNGLSGQFNSMASTISSIGDPIERLKMGADNPFTQSMWEQVDKATESKYREQFNQARDSMSKLSNIFDSYTFDAVSIDLGDVGGSSSSGGSGSKGKKSSSDKDKESDYLESELNKIKSIREQIEQEISIIEEKRTTAENLGRTDLVSDYTKQLADMHEKLQLQLHEENVAMKGLKARLKEEKNIQKVEEEMQSNSLAWYQERNARLEEETKLVDLRYQTELDKIDDIKESYENTYVDIKVNPDEYLEIEKDKLDLLKQEADIIQNKINDYIALGLTEQHESVRELRNELKALKKDILEQSLSNLDLEFDANKVDFDKADDIKSLIESAIDQAEYLEDTVQVLQLRNQGVQVISSEIDKNKMLIQTLREKQSQVKRGSAEYIRYQEQIQESLEKENDLISEMISQYQDLAETQAELQVYGTEGKDNWEKDNNKRIKALQDRKKAIEDETEETEKQEDLQEKLLEIEQLRMKLENLKNQRTIQEYKKQEDGSWQWQYTVDEDAIKETEKELADAEKEYQKSQDKIAKDGKTAQIDAEIEYYQNLADEKEAQYEDAKDKYNEFYQAQLRTTIYNLDNINLQTNSGLLDIKRTSDSGLGKIEEVYSSRMKSIYSKVKEYCDMIREEMESVGLSSASEALGDSNNNSSSSSIKNPLKYTYYNSIPMQNTSKTTSNSLLNNSAYLDLNKSLSKTNNIPSVFNNNTTTSSVTNEIGNITIQTNKDGRSFGLEFAETMLALSKK